MELYRITQEQYADDLSGNGAKLFGGRWNSEGHPALYAASGRALALLETLAHTPAKMLDAKPYILVTIFVPDAIVVQEVDLKKLPEGWDAPDIRNFTQKTGDSFLTDKKQLLLSVPSVIVFEERNFILNPLQSDFKKVKILNKRRIYFDKRVEGNL